MQAAWAHCDVAYATVDSGSQESVPDSRFYKILDATRWNKLRLLLMSVQVVVLLLRERPDVVVTTGAAPGVVGLRFGKWLGARTVWIDSLANAEEMSLSGQKVRAFADLWLTQWEALARPEGPQYLGAVL